MEFNISTQIENLVKKTKCGKRTDLAARVILSGAIQDHAPFQTVEFESWENLLVMMKDCDYPHVYGEGGVFYFSAHYFYDDKYPVGRTYFKREVGLMEIAHFTRYFNQNGVDLPFIPPNKIDKKIRSAGFKDRIKRYRIKQDEDTKHFKGLFEGRKEATIIEKSYFLNTVGCLVCGTLDCMMMTSTISSDKGIMIGFNLCELHMEDAFKENSLIEFLAKQCGQNPILQFSSLCNREHFEMVLRYLPKDIGAEIEKIEGDTVSLVRPSGIKVIARLTAPDNYAYMVFDKSGGQVARIDSADHHSVSYGPDHIHTDLQKGNKAVQSSFTLGSPLVDSPKILRIILDLESNYEN